MTMDPNHNNINSGLLKTTSESDSWRQAAEQLKSYVTAKDDIKYDNVHETTVILDLTHSNLKQRHIEIRFDLHDTLLTLRQRIHQKTGTPATFQYLQVKSPDNNSGVVICEIPPEYDENTKLGYFSLRHGMEIHCLDLDPHSASSGGKLEDTSLVEKYTMTDEEYNQRKNTLRDWERTQKQKDKTFTLAKHAREHRELVEAQRQYKLGYPVPKGFRLEYNSLTQKHTVVKDDNDEYVPAKEDEKKQPTQNNNDDDEDDDEHGCKSVQGIFVNDRCQVQPGKRRGQVMFVGQVPELAGAGYWIGVQFDEPVGKSDGSINGQRYFETLDKHGGFCRAKNVKVGDYPERDLLDSDSDSDADDDCCSDDDEL